MIIGNKTAGEISFPHLLQVFSTDFANLLIQLRSTKQLLLETPLIKYMFLA